MKPYAIPRLLRQIWLPALLLILCMLSVGACAPDESSPPQPVIQRNVPRIPKADVPTSAAHTTPHPAATQKEVRVGVLLPLTGDSATLGNALLDAAMLGLFDKYNAMPTSQLPTKVVLLPKDTEGTAKGAALAAQSALDEGATLFIGPLFAEEVKAVSPLARKAGIAVLSLSNSPDVAGNGVHLFGFLPQQQVARVVKQAYAKDLISVGALVPSNAYGQLVAQALQQVATQENHPLVGIEFYPPGAQDVDMEIQKLLRKGPRGSRPEMDALLIAEGGDKLSHILNRLEIFGVSNKNTQLLGTGLWDDPAVLANPKLAGGWLAGAPLTSSITFDRRFDSQYHYHAPRLASLAYDAVALAVTLAVISPNATYSETLLTKPQGYVGPANGIFRLKANGQSERGLSVMVITPTGFQELKPAPRAFN
ncbi:MAG: penicillin-binding protein activator [Rickettsiales bacterium]|nr:penicillin-binding protein activator [Rickettsiales bacterium]